MKYKCPLCGGTNIQELMLVWFWKNSGLDTNDEVHPAELYDDREWCTDCEKHIESVEEYEADDR